MRICIPSTYVTSVYFSTYWKPALIRKQMTSMKNAFRLIPMTINLTLYGYKLCLLIQKTLAWLTSADEEICCAYWLFYISWICHNNLKAASSTISILYAFFLYPLRYQSGILKSSQLRTYDEHSVRNIVD